MIASADNGFDISAHVKIAFDLDLQRVASPHEIFQNDVDHVFVKNLYLAERIDIELQTFEFDTALVRHVFEANNRKIGKIGKRANRRKFRHLEFDPNLASLVFILESIERVKIHLLAPGRANIQIL